MSNLVTFLKKLIPTVEKSDLLVDLEISMQYMDDLKDALKNMEDYIDTAGLKSPEAKAIEKEFYKNVAKVDNGVRLSSKKNLAKDISQLIDNVKVNAKYIYDQLEELGTDVMSTYSIDNVRLIYIRGVSHLEYISRYTFKLINYIYVKEAESAGIEVDREFKLNHKQEQYVEKNAWIYTRLIAIYGSVPKKFKNKLEGIEEMNISKDNIDEFKELFKTSKVDFIDNLPDNFIGSPIYVIRLMFATWQADRYQELKEEKKLLELRYLHLKMFKENGEADPNTEKEIAYLQKRITDLDYKIAKYEEEAGL